MYQFSRAIYREIAADIDPQAVCPGTTAHGHVLRSCESTIQRLANDRHYFARPARTLFSDIRTCFPMAAQARVWMVVQRYISCAESYLESLPVQGIDASGQPLACRATTRRGTACQRTPMHANGYCPSHQHLAETEEVEAGLIAA
jgi:hypothetical protein